MTGNEQSTGLKQTVLELNAEVARLRHALRWTAGALQEACRNRAHITESDTWRIGEESRKTSEILAAADAALSGESNGKA